MFKRSTRKKRPVTGDDSTNHNNNNNNHNNKWTVKTKVIPVTVGATGTISKSFRKFLSNIPGKHKIKELQQTAILGSTRISRRTNVKVQNIQNGKLHIP